MGHSSSKVATQQLSELEEEIFMLLTRKRVMLTKDVELIHTEEYDMVFEFIRRMCYHPDYYFLRRGNWSRMPDDAKALVFFCAIKNVLSHMFELHKASLYKKIKFINRAARETTRNFLFESKAAKAPTPPTRPSSPIPERRFTGFTQSGGY